MVVKCTTGTVWGFSATKGDYRLTVLHHKNNTY